MQAVIVGGGYTMSKQSEKWTSVRPCPVHGAEGAPADDQGLTTLVHISSQPEHSCGIHWVVSVTKTAQVELKSGPVSGPADDLPEHELVRHDLCLRPGDSRNEGLKRGG